MFGSDKEVAVESKFESARNCDAIDSTDEWLVEFGEWSACACRVLAAVSACAAEVAGSVAEFFQVETSTECWIGAGENDHVYLIVIVGCLHNDGQFGQHF